MSTPNVPSSWFISIHTYNPHNPLSPTTYSLSVYGVGGEDEASGEDSALGKMKEAKDEAGEEEAGAGVE